LRGRWVYRMIGIATVMFLRTSIVQAGDAPAPLPVFTGRDGSRGWVEITHFGNRTKAVLSIPLESVRRMKTSGDITGGVEAPPGESEEKEGGERGDIGNLLKQQASRMVQEGPEGISFGGAFDLLGDIQDALEKGKSGREKRDAVVRALKHVPMEGEPVTEDADHGDRPVGNLSGKQPTP
jgi:hypothetical protein